jgi:uncharacterized protein (DUF1499 family)
MSPLAWMLGLVLPACGFPAAEGLPTPSLMDITHIIRPAAPNTALAAPRGFDPAPDVVTPHYDLSAERLFALIQRVAQSQPRTFQAALHPDQLQGHYVTRSALLNFPDLVTVTVRPDGAASSTVILYSRSVYGHSDFGVNRARVEAWLSALQQQLPPSSEK